MTTEHSKAIPANKQIAEESQQPFYQLSASRLMTHVCQPAGIISIILMCFVKILINPK